METVQQTDSIQEQDLLQPNFKRIRATPLYLICFWISDTAQIDVDRPARSVSTSLSSSTTLVTSACAEQWIAEKQGIHGSKQLVGA